MTNDFIICTFYTPDYQKYVKAWEESVNRFGYEYIIKKAQDKGKWNLNDSQKPNVIREVMRRNPTKNVLWVDVDAVIEKPLTVIHTLGEEGYDMAGRQEEISRSFRGWVERTYHYTKLWQDKFILGGTLWFANTPHAEVLLDLWVDATEADPHSFVGEQDTLNMVLDKHADDMGLRFKGLPFEYCYCKLHMDTEDRLESRSNRKDAVVVQDFASREARRNDKRKALKEGEVNG